MREHLVMVKMWSALAWALATVGLAACGGDKAADVRTVTVTNTQTSAAPSGGVVNGDAILIETRITNARAHTGKVVGVSISEATYCRGGKSSGGSDGPTITSTLRCPEGTLKLEYAPTQQSAVQGAEWRIVSGSGRFKGLHGGGSMVAKFDLDDLDSGREIFTGTVGR